MKKNIHPQWYPHAKITCACGATFTAGSTLPEVHVDVCSACHPFYTGEIKFVDTQGMVEKFIAKQKLAQTKGYIKKRDRKRAKKIEEEKKPRTLKEMLQKK